MKYYKHIVWLVPGFAADETDDECIPPLKILLNELEREFPEYLISIIAFQYPFKSTEYKIGNTIVCPCNGKNRNNIFKINTWLKAIKIFRKINRPNKIDVIHSFWFTECMMVGTLLSKIFNVSHINTLMGQEVFSTNKYLKPYFLKSTHVIAISERQADLFEKNTGYRVASIIHWGIDESNTPAIHAEKNYDIISVGSLIPIKRYDMIIRIGAELKRKFPEIMILIVGSGTEMNSLKNLVNKLDLSENVIFTGNVKNQNVLHLMQQSKIFVHTSSYEGFGFVFLEAIKCGLPIVSFPVGFAKENENWFLANSENEMKERLEFLLKENRSPNANINFTIKETATKYIEFYNLA